MIDKLQSLLCNYIVFSSKVQRYHWNVEGENFLEYHKYFGKLYSFGIQSIDEVAELIRTKGVKVSASLNYVIQNSKIEDSEEILEHMFEELLRDNYKMLLSLHDAYFEADKASDLGIANLLQDKIQEHEKIQWFVKSIMGVK